MNRFTQIIKCLAICVFVLIFTGCSTLQETELQQNGINSTNTMDLLSQADSAYAAREWITAEKIYREIVALLDKDEFSYFRLGNTLLRQGRLKEAAAQLETALLLNPQFTEARHNLATCYMLLADAQMAPFVQKNAAAQQSGAQRKRALLREAAAEPLK